MKKNMKKIYSVIALAAGLVMLASCELNKEPVFNDSDAFVAFNNAAFSCAETDGEISIPVTLASLNGMSTTVSYEAVNGTAKEGVNFELVDGAGTLTFSPAERTQYIKVKILDPGVSYSPNTGERMSGLYTGDLKFTISFKSTGDVAASRQNACTVTIKDTDHPMSALLGNYTMSAVSYFDGPVRWTMSILKDEKDDHMVWFFNIFAVDGFADTDTMFYGNVDADLTTITIPLGQESEYTRPTGYHLTLYGLDNELNDYQTGNLTVTILKDASGAVTGLDFGEELGIWAYLPTEGSLSILMPGIKGTKN